MLDYFPAAPGTKLLQLSGETYFEMPIFGWAVAKSGRAEPVTPAAKGTVAHGTAYVVPEIDGGSQVYDPVYQTFFRSVDDWYSFILVKDETVHAAQDDGAIPYGALGVVFGDKTFVKASYWVFRDSGYEFVFEVEGGEPLPNDSRVTKSNRRDFVALKKVMDVATVEDLKSAPHVGTNESGEGDLDEEAEDLI